MGTAVGTRHDLRGWRIAPDRTRMVTGHTGEVAICTLDTTGSPVPGWTVAGPWQILGWASDRHLALWQRSTRNLVQVIDGDGTPLKLFEVLGRPVQCRLDHAGGFEVLVAMSDGRPALCLYRTASDSYLPIPGSGGVQGVGAWDARLGIFAATLDGAPGVRFFQYDQDGCAAVEVPWPRAVQPVSATGCSAGVVGLSGTDEAGRWVPGVFDLATRSVRWFTDRADGTCVDLARCGRAVLTSTWRDQRFVYRVLDTAGESVAELDPGPGLATDLRFAADGQHLVGLYQSPATPPTVTRWDPAGRTDAVPAAHDVRWRHRWIPDGGRELPEWVFEPVRGGRRGTVLFLHGGPRGQLKQQYDPVIVALVEAGWTVVGMNYPGSAGYSPQYRELGRADWGGADAAAIERRLRALHDAAGDQPVFIYGQSYGAYLGLLVAAALPQMVAAVAVRAPVTDLPALAAGMTGVRRRWLDDELGAMQFDSRLLAQRSPVNRASALSQVRLLVGHGIEDDRCPVEQSRRLVELLRQRQPDAVSYLEDHGGHAPPDWRRWSDAVVAHFTGGDRDG